MVAAGNEVKQLSKDKIELKNEIDTIADLTRENERLKWEAKSAHDETLRVKTELEKTKHEFIPALKESTLRLEQQVKDNTADIPS